MARLQRIGGMGLRTGVHTTGAQYLSSLAKCSEDITMNFLGWNGSTIAQEETGWWLERQHDSEIDVKEIFDIIRARSSEPLNLSISQKCEMKELQRVRTLVSGDELLHLVKRGPGGAWVRVTPISWKE